MNKGLVVFPVVVAAAMMLSGCSGSADAATASSESNTKLSKAEKDEIYLEMVRDEYPASTVSDSLLLQVADASCDAFDKGATISDVVRVILKNGKNAGVEIGYAVGVAVPIYCPEHSSKMKKELDKFK